jgi:hypothetical protein
MATIMRDPNPQYGLTADQADMRIQAFTIDGRAPMPACLIAVTKGEELALLVPEKRPAARGSTISPISRVPRM